MRLILTAFLIVLASITSSIAFENIEEVKAYIEKHSGDEMPDGYALPITMCSDDTCMVDYASMLRDLPKAYKKDYQAQRNVAFCLWDGCQGSVQKNVNLGCAWTIVLLASGSPKVTDLDFKNLKHCLSYAEPGAVGIIKAQAAELYRVIYKREIPADWR